MGYSSPRARGARALPPGYGPGGQVMTDQGEVPLEWLATGDRVLTRDHGFQPLLWIGRMRLGTDEVLCQAAAGAFGPGRPSHPTLLSPRTGVLLSGWEVALHTGVDEALAASADLFERAGPDQAPAAAGATLTHLLLAKHELVQINGLWVETLLLDTATRRALEGFLPPSLASRPAIAAGHARAARPGLTHWEVTAIRAGAADATPRMSQRVA